MIPPILKYKVFSEKFNTPSPLILSYKLHISEEKIKTKLVTQSKAKSFFIMSVIKSQEI